MKLECKTDEGILPPSNYVEYLKFLSSGFTICINTTPSVLRQRNWTKINGTKDEKHALDVCTVGLQHGSQ